jgi:hypothetical protein
VSRTFLRSQGVTHVVPVVCGPYADPVVAMRETYWLRPPSGRTFDEVLRSAPHAVPRVLTPDELARFLETADERELKEISTRLGHVL